MWHINVHFWNAFFTQLISESEKSQLLEMFPDQQHAYAHRGLSMEEILDMLLESIKQRSGVPDLAKELQDHARNFFYPNDDHNIHTTRSCIFNSAQAFYKNAQHSYEETLWLNLPEKKGWMQGHWDANSFSEKWMPGETEPCYSKSRYRDLRLVPRPSSRS